MTTLFRVLLAEHYRPRTWADVVGQDKTVARIKSRWLSFKRSGTWRAAAFFLSGSKAVYELQERPSVV